MTRETINLMIIGFGAHARRIYDRVIQQDGCVHDFRLACVVDLDKSKAEIDSFLGERTREVAVYTVPSFPSNVREVPTEVRHVLNDAVVTHQIQGVILSTEPLSHFVYARWAIENNLSLLIDKPISIAETMSTSSSSIDRIIADYQYLVQLYDQAQRHNSNLLVSVNAQRRYHPGFQKARQALQEVHQLTNCPVTSIQCFHSDGQWRMPYEIVDLDYHPFNRGYGKVSHSGYHFLDIATWLMSSVETNAKQIDNADVFSNFVKPLDFIEQLTPDDHRRIFPEYDSFSKYDDEALTLNLKDAGEIDAFISIAFKQEDRIMTLGSVNLLHNGFSQRGWLEIEGRDLYKGNGRVRHEWHQIVQGPFQSITLMSYQSGEIDLTADGSLHWIGGEFHFDIHIFRNRNLFPHWKSHEVISLRDLMPKAILQGQSRGHQEDARREAVLEFVQILAGQSVETRSDIKTHYRSTQLMYAAYRSALNRTMNINPLVNVAMI